MSAVVPLTIDVRDLTKRFGPRVAVSGVTLAVPAGSVFGFLGHNGAGKTTLIRMLVGLTRPDSGTIAIGGQALAENREQVLARVGAIIEEPRFHGHLSGWENLSVLAAVRGGGARARIGLALERVGLVDRARDRVATYSQGMRQRLGIARCLLADPMLIVLDEPMNGLDPGGILELRRLVKELAAEGRTLFVSSHLLDEVEKTCDAAAVIDQGRLVAHGSIRDLVGPSGNNFELTCDQISQAIAVLDRHPGVSDLRSTPTGIRLTMVDPALVGSVIARLNASGIAVAGLAPVHVSLEDRFLALTSRVGINR